jgi:hypothetical protein
MARGQSNKLKPFQKLLTIMVSGEPVTIEEIETQLGNEIYMYRLSTYMWHIKTVANGVVKSIKDGRKAVAYQIINVNEIKEYMKRAGVASSNFVPGQIQKKPSISKLSDLRAQKQIVNVTEVVVSEEVPEQQSNELVVDNIAE